MGIGGIYSTWSSYVLLPDLFLSQGYMFVCLFVCFFFLVKIHQAVPSRFFCFCLLFCM